MEKIKKYKIKDIKNKILCGDVISELKKIPNESIDTVITSPSYYGLRDYSALYDRTFTIEEEAKKWILQEKEKNKDYFSKIRKLQDVDGKIVGYKAIIYSKFIKKNQVGLEETPQDYIDRMVKVAHEIKRVLKKTGSFWINIADSYWTKSGSGTIYGNLPNQQEDEYGVSGHRHTKRGTGKYPTKCLLQIPQRLAIALTDKVGFTLRNDVIWGKQVLIHKTNSTIGNVMPTSVHDRFNTSYEHLFFFTKNKKYHFNLNSVRIPHQTQSLERYQRAVNLGAIQTQGKIFEDKVDKPMQPPKVFREKFEKDKNYQGKFDGYGIESESYGSPRARNERIPRGGLVPGNTSQARPEHDVRDLGRSGRGGNNPELNNRNFMPTKKANKKADETTMFFQEQKKQGGNTNLPWKPHRSKTQDEYYKIGMRNAPEPNEPNAFNVRGKNIPDVHLIEERHNFRMFSPQEQFTVLGIKEFKNLETFTRMVINKLEDTSTTMKSRFIEANLATKSKSFSNLLQKFLRTSPIQPNFTFFRGRPYATISIKISSDKISIEFGRNIWIFSNSRFARDYAKFSKTEHYLFAIDTNSKIFTTFTLLNWVCGIQLGPKILNKFNILRCKVEGVRMSPNHNTPISKKQSDEICHLRTKSSKIFFITSILSVILDCVRVSMSEPPFVMHVAPSTNDRSSIAIRNTTKLPTISTRSCHILNLSHAINNVNTIPDIWQVNTSPSSIKHFALYPIKLLMRPIKTCLPKNGIVLDPFFGGGTTAIAQRLYCPSGSFIGIEINPEYIKIARKRIKEESPEQLGI